MESRRRRTAQGRGWPVCAIGDDDTPPCPPPRSFTHLQASLVALVSINRPLFFLIRLPADVFVVVYTNGDALQHRSTLPDLLFASSSLSLSPPLSQAVDCLGLHARLPAALEEAVALVSASLLLTTINRLLVSSHSASKFSSFLICAQHSEQHHYLLAFIELIYLFC